MKRGAFDSRPTQPQRIVIRDAQDLERAVVKDTRRLLEVSDLLAVFCRARLRQAEAVGAPKRIERRDLFERYVQQVKADPYRKCGESVAAVLRDFARYARIRT